MTTDIDEPASMKIRVVLLRLAPSMMKPLALGITLVITGTFSSVSLVLKLPAVPKTLVMPLGRGASAGRAMVK
ncbi:hypothetical protein D3C72_1738210 [compost metagenome]